MKIYMVMGLVDALIPLLPTKLLRNLVPEELIAGLVGLSLLIAVIITGSAIMQVMPEGQTVSQSYELDYHLKNDPDSDMKYSLNNGRPLYIQHTIDDNKISEGGSTKISLG